jgi:formylglycine-generating enzyme required for sulfatase activity
MQSMTAKIFILIFFLVLIFPASLFAAAESDVKRQSVSTDRVLDDINQIFSSPTLLAKFALIPAGTFTMGSPSSEPGRDIDETQHPVTISRPF